MTKRIKLLRRLRVLSCLLLVVVCLWLAFRLYAAMCTLTLDPNRNKVEMTSAVDTRWLQSAKRPLVFLTLSYHAAPIYDLMDQLQPLGVKFIERGINAYACRYFNTCRRHDPLKVNAYSESLNLTAAWVSVRICLA